MTAPPIDVGPKIESTLDRLIQGTLELFWDYDRRFHTVVGRVESPDHTPVLSLCDELFDRQWDHESISSAPLSLQAIVSLWGGLRPGQRIYSLAETDSPLLYAAWWPWRSNLTFSLRVGCHISEDGDAHQQMGQHLRKIFRA